MMDFTVIVRVRHEFGDDKHDPHHEIRPDKGAPFSGQSDDFSFSCPNVDPGEEAVLQLEHRGATYFEDHPVFINGQKLFGGISAGPLGINNYPNWVTRSLIVGKNILRDENTLRIEVTSPAPFSNNFDNFTVDNVVIFFKIRDRVGPILGAKK